MTVPEVTIQVRRVFKDDEWESAGDAPAPFVIEQSNFHGTYRLLLEVEDQVHELAQAGSKNALSTVRFVRKRKKTHRP